MPGAGSYLIGGAAALAGLACWMVFDIIARSRAPRAGGEIDGQSDGYFGDQPAIHDGMKAPAARQSGRGSGLGQTAGAREGIARPHRSGDKR